MKNLFKSALMLLACGAFFACSSEDEVTENPVFKGNTAYINVNLKYSDAGTRALADGSTGNPKYTDATGAEKAVKTVNFYFYDENGDFVTEGQVWNNPATTDDKTTGDTYEIETNVTKKVVLSNLTGKGYPRYMTVVANKPVDTNLDNQLKSNIATANQAIANAVINTDASGPVSFIMSSSAEANGQGWKNYAVEIKAENFIEHDPADGKLDDTNTIVCFIERVAAKVNVAFGTASTKLVNVASSQTITVAPVVDGAAQTPVSYTGCEIYQVVPASVNDQQVNGAAKTLYVGFTKWALNVTAKKYYPYKEIAETTDWMKSAKRSFWENCPLYNDNTAKFASSETSIVGGSGSATNAAFDVVYTPFNQISTALNAPNYCTPNTNTVALLRGHYNNRATSMLMGAILLEKVGDAYKPLSLYRCNGKLYTAKGYVDYVLSLVSQASLPRKKVTDAATGTVAAVTPVAADFMTGGVPNVYNLGDGRVGLYINATSTGSDDTKWYTDETLATEKTYATLADAKIFEVGGVDVSKAEFYNSGMMYYSVPIEHNIALDATKKYMSEGYNDGKAGDAAQLGDYGVVRNHAYALTITAVENLGHAVYDPTKDIVPNDEDNKLYFLGATINVLSWRNVVQNVGL